MKHKNLYTYSAFIFTLLVGAGIIVYSYKQEDALQQEQKITPATLIQQKHLMPELPPVATTQDTLPTTSTHELSDIWSDFKDRFENKRFHYTFEHSSTTEIDVPDGKGADFSSDIGSQITIIKKDCSFTSPNPSITFRNCTSIFNVIRLYLDEDSIQGGIATNVERLKEDPYFDKTYIDNYTTSINQQFADARKYRDISREDFTAILKNLPVFDQSKTRDVIVDGLPATEFTWLEHGTSTETLPALKLGYSAVTNPDRHKIVFFEGPTGEKYYIHYKPDDKESVQMFKTFHFIR